MSPQINTPQVFKIASAFYPCFFKENIRRRCLTSKVCMCNLMLCQEQHVAHELWAEQVWSKKWRRIKNDFVSKQIRNIFQIKEILASLCINQICIWVGVIHSNDLKHSMSFGLQYQQTTHRQHICFKWFPELIENIYLNNFKWLVYIIHFFHSFTLFSVYPPTGKIPRMWKLSK